VTDYRNYKVNFGRFEEKYGCPSGVSGEADVNLLRHRLWLGRSAAPTTNLSTQEGTTMMVFANNDKEPRPSEWIVSWTGSLIGDDHDCKFNSFNAEAEARKFLARFRAQAPWNTYRLSRVVEVAEAMVRVPTDLPLREGPSDGQ
jgi:hypothetical protein